MGDYTHSSTFFDVEPLYAREILSLGLWEEKNTVLVKMRTISSACHEIPHEIMPTLEE